MNGNGYARLGPPYRAKHKRTISTVAFSGVGFFFVILVFFYGHSNIIRMHGAMQSPTIEQPAGWATLHRTTTVQSATVTISGSAITGSALTATTTETAAAGTSNPEAAATAAAAVDAAAAAAAATVAAPASSSTKSSLVHMLGDLQHSLHALLATHAGWKPGDKITRAQLAAAAAASMPDEDRDIELQPHKVAQVVGGAKLHQQMQRLSQQGAAALSDPAADMTTAEEYASLYGHGGGTVVFAPHNDLGSCPDGSASPGTAQAAVVLLAGSSAAALKRSLDGLMLLYSRAGEDVRAAFHLYVGLDSDDAGMRQMALNYAYDSLGAVKLVHHSSSGSKHLNANKLYDAQQELKGAAAPAVNSAADAKPSSSSSSSSSGSGQAGSTGSTAAAPKAAGKGAKSARALLAAAAPAANAGSSSTASAISTTTTGSSSAKAPTGSGTSSKPSTGPPVKSSGNASSSAKAPAGSSSSNSVAAAVAVARNGTSNDHLRLMLHVFFDCFKYPAVLLLEDDVKLAPDFLEFYAATQWLMGSDSSLYCISAWNPVGHQQDQVHPHRIIRTDFNPGKGWLLSRELGLQLLSAWPQGAFDWQQHVRSKAVREGRQCLVPEMTRIVPAGADDTSELAHIHDPSTDGKKRVTTDHAATAAQGGVLSTAAASSAGSTSGSTAQIPAAAAESDAEGVIDMEAYSDDDAADFMEEVVGQEVEGAAASSQPGAGQAASSAEGSSAAGGQRHQRHRAAGWMHQDLSMLLGDNYRHYMHQLLRAARLCDVAGASVLSELGSACLVPYTSSAYLTTMAHTLGIPVEVKMLKDMDYCYILPHAPDAAVFMHCQDYLPEMAYDSVVSGYNRHGARLYLVHAKYYEALQKASGQQPVGPPAAAKPRSGATAQTAEKKPAEVPVPVPSTAEKVLAIEAAAQQQQELVLQRQQQQLEQKLQQQLKQQPQQQQPK